MDSGVLWQRVEGAFVLFASILIVSVSDSELSWWLALLLFFAPDLSFIAYLFGPRIGAIGYNLVHVYAFGSILLALGIFISSPLFMVLGALWLGHSGFDRMLGYGLKLPGGFNTTHLGIIVRNNR